jgi:Bifunctional DNA primase/polymerase, N-terminal
MRRLTQPAASATTPHVGHGSCESATVREAALAHARAGRPVFPCHTARAATGRCSCGRAACPDVGKHPLVAHGFKDATTNVASIEQWWTRWPHANVALRTGEGSCVDVLDVDPHHGGLDALRLLEEEHGPLPPTWRVRTGSGGLHIYFWHCAGLSNSTGRIGEGLDVRADGGYALLPPSVHRTGRRYTWITAPDGGPLAPWPDWLVQRALPRPARQTVAPSAAQGAAGPLPVPPGLLGFCERGACQGERNSKAFWLACELVRECGPTEEAREALELFARRCRPALPAAEVARLWSNAQGRETCAPRTPAFHTVDLATGERTVVRRGIVCRRSSGSVIPTQSTSRRLSDWRGLR